MVAELVGINLRLRKAFCSNLKSTVVHSEFVGQIKTASKSLPSYYDNGLRARQPWGPLDDRDTS